MSCVCYRRLPVCVCVCDQGCVHRSAVILSLSFSLKENDCQFSAGWIRTSWTLHRRWGGNLYRFSLKIQFTQNPIFDCDSSWCHFKLMYCGGVRRTHRQMMMLKVCYTAVHCSLSADTTRALVMSHNRFVWETERTEKNLGFHQAGCDYYQWITVSVTSITSSILS